MGLLLVVYGALALWLGRASTAADPARLSFCMWLVCPETSSDSPTAINPAAGESLAQARTELQMDGASAYRWADLADAEVEAHNVDAGRFCIRQALDAAPGNPAIQLRVSKLYLRLEDYPETLQHLITILRNPDLGDYYDNVFAMYSRMDMPLKELLNEGLPRTPKAANAFLRFWINQDKLDEARETWDWINDNGLGSLQSAGSYVALLAKDGRWDDAIQSWSRATSQFDSAYTKTNWVYDGSFETNPVDCPFDWHWAPPDACSDMASGCAPQDSAQVTRDTGVGYEGHASLRLTYQRAPNPATPQAFQTVLLTPGEWQLKAAMKTLALTGDQGVVIRVVDATDASRLDASTDTFERTQEWTAVSKTFQVGGKTHLARVEILLPPGRSTNVQPTGTVWVDAVELSPLP